MAFSPNGGQYLASSGKDHRLCLWKNHNHDNTNDTLPDYSMVYAIDTAHKRIVWSLHFCPFLLCNNNNNNDNNNNSMVLASGSRDGLVKIWTIQPHTDEIVELYQLEPMKATSNKSGKKKVVEAITAVAFAPIPHPNNNQTLILAIGMECGCIEIWSIHLHDNNNNKSHLPTSSCQLLMALPHSHCHTSSIKKLVWRPMPTSNDTITTHHTSLTLASCGLDHGVRIFTITFDKQN